MFFYGEQNKSLKKMALIMPISQKFLLNWFIFKVYWTEQLNSWTAELDWIVEQLNYSTIQSSAILNSC